MIKPILVLCVATALLVLTPAGPALSDGSPAKDAAYHLEVSVLSIPRPLDFKSPEELLAKLRPQVDGVVLQVGRSGATYLPQVWEQLPAKKDFLGHLAEKAGLKADAWRAPGAKVLTYQVEAFHERE